MSGILIAGAFLAGLLVYDAHLGLLGALISIGIAVCVCIVKPDWPTVAVALICLVCVGFGFCRASGEEPSRLPDAIASRHQFSGRVLGVPRPTASGTRAEVQLDDSGGLVVQAQLPPFPVPKQGDLVRFTGDVDVSSRTPSSSGPRVTIWARSVEITGSRARTWQRARTAIADKASGRLTMSVPLPAGALAAGILIGDDSALTSRERDQFRAAGLSHITAVSGWNIALVTGLLMLLHGHIPLALTPRIVLGIVAIWIYTYLTGSEPSAVRAAVMGSICLFAIWRGRPRDTLTILLWAIAAMLVIQPVTRHSLGFQLSVFATLGLVLAMPLMAKCPGWAALILVPAIAEISVAPVLLHELGQYSLVSPLANLIVAPLIVPLAAASAATVTMSFVSLTAGRIIGVLPWLLGKPIIGVAAFSSSIPLVSGHTPYLSWNAMVMVYGLLALAVLGSSWLVSRVERIDEDLRSPVRP